MVLKRKEEYERNLNRALEKNKEVALTLRAIRDLKVLWIRDLHSQFFKSRKISPKAF